MKSRRAFPLLVSAIYFLGCSSNAPPVSSTSALDATVKSGHKPQSSKEAHRSPPNVISTAALDRLVEKIKPGMTEEEVTAVFGFAPEPERQQQNANDNGERTWVFYRTDHTDLIHGNSISYVAEFSADRLTKGGLYVPL